MGKIWIAGLGPGGLGQMTLETRQLLQDCDQIILRTARHPAAGELAAQGLAFHACDDIYEKGQDFQQVYQEIAAYVLAAGQAHDQVCFCVPGHPCVAEETVGLLLTQGPALGLAVEVVAAMSFLDPVFALLKLDPIKEGLALRDALAFCGHGGTAQGQQPQQRASLILPCLFTQVYDPFVAGELKLALLESLPPDLPVQVVYHAGIIGEARVSFCPLAELDHDQAFDHLTSVYVPVPEDLSFELTRGDLAGEDGYPLDALVAVFDRLLGPGGCPWDQKQTHESLKPYLIEEANEALEAIDRKDMGHLCEELGDVLMQIVFHAALAKQKGSFDINDVIRGITEKMMRRHPHVFGQEKAETPEDVARLWQRVKAEERRGQAENS